MNDKRQHSEAYEKQEMKSQENEASILPALFDGIDDAIYVSDPETHELLFVNQAIRNEWGGASVGNKCHKVLQGRDAPCPFCTNNIIFGEKLGQSHVWEFQNEITRRWYRCSDKAILWNDGRLVRFELASDITERKRAEELLRESTSYNQQIINSVQDGIIVYDGDLRYRVWNPQMEIISGVPAEKVLGKRPLEIFPFLKEAGMMERLEKILAGEQPVTVTFDVKDPVTGRIDWNEDTSAALRNADGEIIGVIGVVRDITERKKAEAMLRESESLYRTVVENVNDVLIFHDFNGDIIDCNENASFMLGYARSKLLKGNVSLVTPEAGKPRINKRMADLLSEGRLVFESEVATKSGENISVSVSSRVVSRNGNGVVQSFIRDVTERKKSEKALKESEKKFRTIFNNSNDVMALLAISENRLERTFMINDRAVELLGYSKEEIFEMELVNIVAAEHTHKLPGIIAEIIKGKCCFETELVRKDRRKTPVEVSAVIIEIDATKYALLNIRDLTEKIKAKEMEKRLHEQEKHAVIGKVAGKMAHDFNNVLAIIMGTSQRLQTEELPLKVKKDIDIILECSHRGRDFTRNLMLFAKDQEPKFKRIDLNEKIDLVLRSLKSELKDVEVTCVHGAAMENVLADGGLLVNALVNLIMNSIHAMSKTEKPELHVRTYADKDNVYIEIEDNGCGIPASWKEKVFEPAVSLKGSGDKTDAYRRDIKGSGYGLSNVKQCVDKHGGTVEFESEEGKGAKFRISLPVIKGHLSCEEMVSIHKKERVEGKRILIVEDEPHFASVLHSLLEKFNHKIDLTTEGEMALDLINNNAYDAVSLDFLLPDMNGLEVYRNIRETNKEMPIIFVSGNFEFLQSMVDLKKEDPNVDHMSKPFDNVDYVNKMHEWLANRTN